MVAETRGRSMANYTDSISVTEDGTDYAFKVAWDSDYDDGNVRIIWSKQPEGSVPVRSVIDVLNKRLLEDAIQELKDAVSNVATPIVYELLVQVGAPISSICEDFGLTEVVKRHDMEGWKSWKLSSNVPGPSYLPFNNIDLARWFFVSHRNDSGLSGSKVWIVGSGPFRQGDFRGLLERFDVTAEIYPAERVDQSSDEFARGTVIIGRDDWDEATVNGIIDDHSGGELRVYSQEMFLAFVSQGRDPLHSGASVLDLFRVGHPGLEMVSDGWAGWVTTYVVRDWRKRGSKGTSTSDQPTVEISPLGEMGYSVRADGPSENERRRLLSRAFRGPIPWVESAMYMAEWGKPGSSERLRRIKTHLDSMIDSKFGQESMAAAVQKWQHDRSWLRAEFYRGHYKFQWPTGEVAK